MASIRDLAQGYAIRFVNASNKKQVLDEIVNEINSLVYETNNQPISYDTKLTIVDTIRKILAKELGLLFKDGGVLVEIRQTDNDKFLTMIDYVTSQLNK